MKSLRLLGLAALVLCVSACTAVRPLDTEPAGLHDLNLQLSGERVQVHLSDGTRAYALGPRFAADSTSWVDPASGRLRTVATREIIRMETFSRGRGAVRGAQVGALVGAGVGLVAGLAFDALLSELFVHRENRTRTMVVLALSGAANGALGGAIHGTWIGAVRGDRVIYERVPDGPGPAQGAPGDDAPR